MWSMRIVVDPPCFDLVARIFDRQELRDVQTLIAQVVMPTAGTLCH